MPDRDEIQSVPNAITQARTSEALDQRLAPLGELDKYQVAGNQPDIRGWEVRGTENRRIGSVHDLIVDVVALEVRYLVVSLDGELTGDDAERQVLMPIAPASLDDDQNVVRLPAEPTGGFANAPTFEHAAVTINDERRLRELYGDAGLAGPGVSGQLDHVNAAREAGRAIARAVEEDQRRELPHRDE